MKNYFLPHNFSKVHTTAYSCCTNMNAYLLTYTLSPSTSTYTYVLMYVQQLLFQYYMEVEN